MRRITVVSGTGIVPLVGAEVEDGKVNSYLTWQGLGGHGKKFEFCSGCHGKSLRGFKQTDDMPRQL